MGFRFRRDINGHLQRPGSCPWACLDGLLLWLSPCRRAGPAMLISQWRLCHLIWCPW